LKKLLEIFSAHSSKNLLVGMRKQEKKSFWTKIKEKISKKQNKTSHFSHQTDVRQEKKRQKRIFDI
jgi:hypothetical protein